MLSEIARVDALLQPILVPLMRSQFATLQTALKPGLTFLNWTSLGIHNYMDNVLEHLHQMELLAERSNDLCAYRIDVVSCCFSPSSVHVT